MASRWQLFWVVLLLLSRYSFSMHVKRLTDASKEYRKTKSLLKGIRELAKSTRGLPGGRKLLVRALRVLGETDTDEGRAYILARSTALACDAHHESGEDLETALIEQLETVAIFDPELPRKVATTTGAYEALLEAARERVKSDLDKGWLTELHKAFVALGFVKTRSSKATWDATRMMLRRQHARILDRSPLKTGGLYRGLSEYFPKESKEDE